MSQQTDRLPTYRALIEEHGALAKTPALWLLSVIAAADELAAAVGVLLGTASVDDPDDANHPLVRSRDAYLRTREGTE